MGVCQLVRLQSIMQVSMHAVKFACYLASELPFANDIARWLQTAQGVNSQCARNPRLAAERAFVDERGGVGIRLESTAAVVRQYGGQFRWGPGAGKERPNRRRCSEGLR
jgi:hypothetical protein